MNLGSLILLKTVFPDIFSIIRPKVIDNNNKDPNQVVGFTKGERCFFIYITNSSTTKLSETLKIKFLITQHGCDGEVMRKLVTLFQCGRIESASYML